MLPRKNLRTTLADAWHTPLGRLAIIMIATGFFAVITGGVVVMTVLLFAIPRAQWRAWSAAIECTDLDIAR